VETVLADRKTILYANFIFSVRLALFVQRWRQEAAKGVGGCDCPLQGLGFGERDNIRDRILHAKAIGGTLGAEQFNFRGSDLGIQAGDTRLS
jgi:hypothetical protein